MERSAAQVLLVGIAALAVLLVGGTLAWYAPLPLTFIVSGVVALALAFSARASFHALPTPASMTHGPSTDELRSVLAGFDDGVIAYDTSFRITFINAASERIFGVPTSSLLGTIIQPQRASESAPVQRIVQIIYPSLAPVMIPHTPQGQYPQVLDLSFTDPTLNLRVTTIPMHDATGTQTGFMKILRDRTRELSIIQSKNEFITVASHQLRTPLTEILWSLESMRSATTDATVQQLIDRTTTTTQNMIRITEDLLGVAKIEEGRFGYHMAATDLTRFLDETLAPLLPIVEGAGMHLYFDRPTAPLAPAYIDPQKISMVIGNLVENAIRYNVAQGTITVKLTSTDDPVFLRVSVTDTGIGISPADAQKLFVKFFRSETASRIVPNGSGLGLYIAKNIVQAHGGQIGVTSEPNRGSTFYFTLTTDPQRVPQREVGHE